MFWAMLAGAIIGALVARQKGGEPLDQVQYAIVYGLIGAVAALFLSILLTRVI